jgi:hypothetical protein
MWFTGLQMTNLLPLFGRLERRSGGLDDDDFARRGNLGFWFHFCGWGRRPEFDLEIYYFFSREGGGAWPLRAWVPECWAQDSSILE